MGLYLGSTKIPTISFYKSGAIVPSGIFNIPSDPPESYLSIDNMSPSSTSMSGTNAGCIWNITWIKDLQVGETYEVNIDFYRSGYYRHYVYNGDVTFSSFPFTIVTSSTTSYHNANIIIDNNNIKNTNVSDDDTLSYNKLTISISTKGYNGTYDVTSYAFAQGDFGYGRLPERISGDMVEYNNSTASLVTSYAFAGLNISSISMPAVKSIYSGAFLGCANLTSVEFPSCTSIGSSAFANCFNLTYISFPACTFIASGAFTYCSKLESVNFPVCTSVNNGAFSYCNTLSTVSLPLILSATQYLFHGCSSLSSVNLLSCNNIQYGAFQQCSILSLISLPNCSSIATYAFYGCYHLLSLYLMSTSVVSLAAIAAFTNTPISNYTTSTGGVYGSIYVPASLLASYKAATNWTTFSDRFVGV